MEGYEFDVLGWVHFGSAILAMILGAVVVIKKKGTKFHVQVGYSYAAMMLILNITALMIYQLFGQFGPFHFAAVISLISIFGGLIPAYLKKPEKIWLEFHYEFMNWSVIGLYAAFWSETFSRFFRFAGFWVLVTTATAMTVSVGWYLLKKKKKIMMQKYGFNQAKESA